MPLESGRWPTLVDMCASRAAEDPERVYFTYLPDGRTVGASLTAEAVDRGARALAVLLLRHADPGDRVLLAYPPGLEFIVGFFGCLYAGLIAVPIPPVEIGRTGPKTDKVDAVCGSAEPRVLLTTQSALTRLDGAGPSRRWPTWSASPRTRFSARTHGNWRKSGALRRSSRARSRICSTRPGRRVCPRA